MLSSLPESVNARLRGGMSLDQAYAHCVRLAQAHYENFPVASRLLRPERRKAVAAIYAFARQADDFADEPQYGGPQERLELLKAWEAKLDDSQDDPVFMALADACQRFSIPKQLLKDLLHAFRQDVSQNRYADFRDLHDYCRRSADPVGRMVLAIHGRASDDCALLSDAICTGLQLANFWQDLRSDIQERGRCYLPDEDLLRFGVELEDLTAARFTPALRSLMCFEVTRTRAFFEQGQDLPRRLGGLLGLEIRLTLEGGRAICDAIEAQDFDTLKARPKLGRKQWLKVLLKTLWGRS
jgi:squalene synthase HpnC